MSTAYAGNFACMSEYIDIGCPSHEVSSSNVMKGKSKQQSSNWQANWQAGNSSRAGKLVAGLLIVTVVYQVAYRHILVRTLPDQQQADFDELDEHCSADSKSLQCTELIVFHKWQKADAARSNGAEDDQQLEMLVHDVAPRRGQSVDVSGEVAPALPPQNSFLAPPMEAPQSAFDKLYEETLAKMNAHKKETYHSPFETDFDVLKSRYAEHEKKLHDIHEAHHHHAHTGDAATDERIDNMDKFEKLYEDSMASMAAHENDKTEFQKESEKELDHLKDAQHKLALAHEHHEHTTTAAPHLDPLMEKIQSFGHELCATPAHRRLKACRQFLAPAEIAQEDKELAADAASRHSMRVVQRKRLHDEMDQWDAHFAEHDHHLCDDSRHRNSSHCRELRESGKLEDGAVAPTPIVPQAQEASPKGFLAASDDLQWSDVVAAGAKASSHGDKKQGLVSYNKTDLRHLRFGMHWGAKIPKVACIAPIPCIHSARAHMQYFIDNFKLQHYEGEKELLLVYRHHDAETEAIVKAHENGKDIRAIAVYDTHEFPSATAFRYASWQARDADIVARWNYDEWYGPERLSMQVRALAASKRPVSLLKYWTVLAGAGKELMSTHGGPGWEGSIVGEAGWMRKHWMPMMEGERALLMDHYSHDIVQVDKPDLLVYNAESNHSKDMMDHFGLQDVV